MLPRWLGQKNQGQMLCTGRETTGGYWLFWNLGSCGTMVDSTYCYDLICWTEFVIRPVQYSCRFYPCKSSHHKDNRGFDCGNGDEVLRLKRTLYCLIQSPWYFFEYITEYVIKQGLTVSKFDPCLFMRKLLIVIVNVDNILIYGWHNAEIDNLIERLKNDDIALNCEGTAEGYFGVDIQREGNQRTLK